MSRASFRGCSAIAAIVVGSCAAPIAVPCERDGDCPVDLACAGDGVCGSSAVTRVFVISALAIPGTDGTHAHGLDLDGVTSPGDGTGCVERARDFVSWRDPLVTGIDDAMATIVPTIATYTECPEGMSPEACVAAAATASVGRGSTLVAIELRDVNAWRDDPSVELVVHRARVPGCADGEVCAPALDGGRLAAGQTFALERMASGTGSITAGTLRASIDGPIRVALALGEVVVDLVLREARLEARVDATGMHDAVLAGGMSLDDISPPTCGITGKCVPSPLASIADLDPDPDDPTMCRRLSITLTFSAIPARGS